MLMLPVLIALIFAPLAGVMAYIITYSEYSKHLVDKRRVRKRAMEAGLVTFLFFLVIPPVLIWLFLGR
ncbi:MAG: hypothetical protein ACXW2O_11355 [Candidatus Aminicenantales bacterium]